jgi:alcohol dehydrogenase class IV
MRFNSERKPGLYRRVGAACELDLFHSNPAEADEKTIRYIEQLLREIGINPGLRHHGVKESHIPALTEQAFDDPCHKTNAVPCSKEDLENLYRAAF